MKVLLLSAGNSVHTKRWATAFDARGHEVHLVTQHAPVENYPAGVEVHRLPHFSGLGYALNGDRLRRLIKELRPDVVNAHYATGYGTLASGVRSVPVVLNVWGSDVFAFPEKSALHRWLLMKNIAAADRVVSTSKAMADRVRSLMGHGVQVDVIPFGVDTERFKPSDRPSAEKVVVIGTVKRLEPVYGVDLLVEAFIRLRSVKESSPLRLRIVGGGSESSRLREMVDRAGLNEFVEFVGPVQHDAVVSELQKLDVYVALSREESFGVAVVEASACALPVVVSNVGGLPEVVQDKVTGTVVPAGSTEAAANAIADLIRDPALRERMGNAGRNWVKQEFEWERCVDRMLAVLEEAKNTSRNGT